MIVSVIQTTKKWNSQTCFLVTRCLLELKTVSFKAILCLLKMPENSICKGEKTPWTRVRQWLCFLTLIIMMTTSLFIFYNSSFQVSWPLNFWTTSSWPSQSYNNVTPSAGTVPPLQYFVAYPHQYKFIVDEPIRCLKESPFLVLMVPVAPHNREARDIIRNTWGKETTVLGQEVSHYFLLGLSKEGDGLEDLQEQSSAIIQASYKRGQQHSLVVAADGDSRKGSSSDAVKQSVVFGRRISPGNCTETKPLEPDQGNLTVIHHVLQ